MKILKLLQKKNKKSAPSVVDFYQDSIQKNGRDQIKKLVEKGLSLPVFLL